MRALRRELPDSLSLDKNLKSWYNIIVLYMLFKKVYKYNMIKGLTAMQKSAIIRQTGHSYVNSQNNGKQGTLCF